MSPEIVLTPTAKDTLLSSITFIRKKWGGKPAEKVAERVWCVLDVITRKPYFFKVRQQNNVRRALITTHISVFYRVHQNCIEVLFFIDDRWETYFKNTNTELLNKSLISGYDSQTYVIKTS